MIPALIRTHGGIPMKASEVEIQRRYYAETANKYDDLHVRGDNEHYFALSFLIGAIDYLKIETG